MMDDTVSFCDGCLMVKIGDQTISAPDAEQLLKIMGGTVAELLAKKNANDAETKSSDQTKSNNENRFGTTQEMKQVDHEPQENKPVESWRSTKGPIDIDDPYKERFDNIEAELLLQAKKLRALDMVEKLTRSRKPQKNKPVESWSSSKGSIDIDDPYEERFDNIEAELLLQAKKLRALDTVEKLTRSKTALKRLSYFALYVVNLSSLPFPHEAEHLKGYSCGVFTLVVFCTLIWYG